MLEVMDTLLKKLGQNVRSLREKQVLTQEKLALLCDLDRTYIGGIERGERNVSIINLAKIARALDIKPMYLLKGVELDADI
jgi:transcriptional regulator with XRE-family HTH domain